MRGRHTYDIIAKAINSVFMEYHIQNKVCCTTTDNGSNFVKAFRTFEKEKSDELEESEEFHNISELLTTDDVENASVEDIITLPPHHRCVSHTLNLIAVKDSEKALHDILYKKMYRTTIC
ncbi:unnamed protein product [Lasius platythorax]|uniref:Uncharacterized protein n=1 Tax=Lasius platythorax TaxID=488582 RepID=A0AAV2MW99_9HYME